MADSGVDEQAVFRALADPTRRDLLDALRECAGQTLGELSAARSMSRQAVTQHLTVLEDAGLVTVVRRGRERLHYLNPVPLHEIQERWISSFDAARVNALSDIARRASRSPSTSHSTAEPEEPDMTARPDYVYVTYIRATPEAVWDALVDADLTASYWGHSNVSDGGWAVGSSWAHVRTDGSGIEDVVGTVLESDRPRRLVITFGSPAPNAAREASAPEPSIVTFEVEPFHDIVKLTVVHERLETDEDLEAISAGWPAVLANLKTLLETGAVLPQDPWDMHEQVRDRELAKNDPS